MPDGSEEEPEKPGTEDPKPDEGETEKPGNGETEQPGENETGSSEEGTTEKPGSGETEQPGDSESGPSEEGTTEKPNGGETGTPDKGEAAKPDGAGTVNKAEVKAEEELLPEETGASGTSIEDGRFYVPEMIELVMETDPDNRYGTGLYARWEAPLDENGKPIKPNAIQTAIVRWGDDDRYYFVSQTSNRKIDERDGYIYARSPETFFINESGEYQIWVCYVMNAKDAKRNLLNPNNDSEAAKEVRKLNMSISERYPYEVATERMETPQNIIVDTGRVGWDLVDGTDWYAVKLEFGKNNYENVVANLNDIKSYVKGDRVVNWDWFKNEMKAGQKLRYSVTALSPDVETWNNSEESWSAYFDPSEKQNAQISNVQKLFEEAQEKGDYTAFNEKIKNPEMKDGELEDMRKDLIASDDTFAAYQKLEENYLTANPDAANTEIISGDDSYEHAASVEVYGGALNGLQSIDFSRKATESEASPSDAMQKMLRDYNTQNLLYMDITAYTEDDNALGQLTWPVVITMPAPDDIAPNLLRIIHEREDGKVEEIMPRFNEEDGTITFAITHFSLFAFAEQKKPSRGTGGSGGGSSVTPRLQPNGTWHQDAAGWWFTKKDGSYPADAWFECYWNGQMNWYHFNAQGYLDAGWFTDKDGQTYFLHDQHDNRFGYMYTGWNWIGGKCYYFRKAASSDGAKQGALVKNTMTPDGYSVGADGAWTVDGTVQTK